MWAAGAAVYRGLGYEGEVQAVFIVSFGRRAQLRSLHYSETRSVDQ